MIPLENQVTSLELSKRLKELGVKQDAVDYWLDINDDDKPEGMLLKYDEFVSTDAKNCYSAFTVAELERKIFQIISNQMVYYDFLIRFSPTGGVWKGETFYEMYEVQLVDWLDEGETIMERADTGANARAKLIIHLIENKLVEGE